MIRALIVRILSHAEFESTTLRKKKSSSPEILIQIAPLPLVHSHSVSYGRFKRRLVDFPSDVVNAQSGQVYSLKNPMEPP